MNPRNPARRAFTLVEMLLATTLAAILMGGVLTATAALARDRRRMEARTGIDASSGVMEIIHRDLANGAALLGPADANGFDLVSFAGIDGKTFAANQRLTQVTYRIVRSTRQDAAGVLIRGQAYLDDAIRPDRWNDVVAAGVKRVVITPVSDDADAVRLGDEVAERLSGANGRGGMPLTARRVPSRLRVRIEFADRVIDREMVLR
jgi:prepilin-type N-terminal cleavage/methylation domain-containing protein